MLDAGCLQDCKVSWLAVAFIQLVTHTRKPDLNGPSGRAEDNLVSMAENALAVICMLHLQLTMCEVEWALNVI